MNDFDPLATTFTHYSFYRPSKRLTGLYTIHPWEIDKLRSYVHRLSITKEGLRAFPPGVVVQNWDDLVEYVKVVRGSP